MATITITAFGWKAVKLHFGHSVFSVSIRVGATKHGTSRFAHFEKNQEFLDHRIISESDKPKRQTHMCQDKKQQSVRLSNVYVGRDYRIA